MRTIIWGGFLVATLILQATVVPMMAIDGVRPDILLIIVVSSALLLGKDQGIGIGFFAGLFQDLASGNIFGLNVLSKMVTGYLAGSMERNVFKENVLLPVMAVILATLINSLIMMCTLFILGYEVYLMTTLLNMLYLTAYNALMAIPVHLLVYRVSRNWVANQSS